MDAMCDIDDLDRMSAMLPPMFDKQDEAQAVRAPNQVLFKYTPYKFGASEQRGLVNHMLRNHTELYEVIEGASRLYVDIEQEFPEEPDNLKEWFDGLMAMLRKSIAEHLPIKPGTEHDYQVCNDSRPSGGKFKASFHVVWRVIVMASNSERMKQFVRQHFDKVLLQQPDYCYSIKLKNRTETRSAVDRAVYTTRRAFRMPYAVKNGKKTFLKPWDESNWCELEFDNVDAKAKFIEEMLVCYQDDEEGVAILPDPPKVDKLEVDKQPPRKRRRVEKPPDAAEEVKEVKEQEPEEPVDVSQQEMARQLVSVLSRERAAGRLGVGGTFEVWSQVVWCIADLFNGNKVGEMLAQVFSSRADNYDPLKTTETYNRFKKGTWTIGSLIQWAREDDKPKAGAIVRSFKLQEALEPHAKGPCLDFTELRELLSEEYTKLYALQQADAEPAVVKKQLAVIHEASVPYLNQFLFVVTDSNPCVYGTEKLNHMANPIVNWCKNLEDLIKANGAFSGHIKFWSTSPDQRKFNTTYIDMRTTDNEEKPHLKTRRKNLFTGFDFPSTYDKFPDNYVELCKPMTEHLMHVWAKDDPLVYAYIINWLAMTIQQPWIKIGVGFLIKGHEGAGKGIVVQKTAEIMGSKYFYQITNPDKELYGQFAPVGFINNKLALIDEATYGGDHTAAGKLKAFLSEKTIAIEPKYLGREVYDSFSNVIVISNNDWLAWVGTKERRWLGLEVADTHAGNNQADYFDVLAAVPVEAWAKFLYSVDLTDFKPRNVPRTEFLRDQKRRAMSPLNRWVEYCLTEGQLMDEQFPGQPGDEWETSSVSFTADQLFSSFKVFAKTQLSSVARLPDLAAFMKGLKKTLELGEARQVTRDGKRVRITDFPVLHECRARFSKHFDDKEWTFGEAE